MTGPFVKNNPALQLLSSSASFSWALQKEAQRRAWCVSGDNRESLGETVGILLMLCTSGAEYNGRARDEAWSSYQRRAKAARHPARGEDLLYQEVYWPLSWECSYLYVSFELQMFLAGRLVRGRSRSSQRRNEVGMMIFIFSPEGNVTRGWTVVAGQAAVSASLHCAPVLTQTHMGRLATVIRSVMRGAWECVEVTGLKCPFPPHQNNF